MKTCPNPKCAMSGIPDDAKFCPKCGAELHIAADSWAQKRVELQQKREKLISKKKRFEQFEEERKHVFFEIVCKNEVYQKELEKSLKIIKRNHRKEIIRESRVVPGVCFWLFVGGGIVMSAG